MFFWQSHDYLPFRLSKSSFLAPVFVVVAVAVVSPFVKLLLVGRHGLDVIMSSPREYFKYKECVTKIYSLNKFTSLIKRFNYSFFLNIERKSFLEDCF